MIYLQKYVLQIADDLPDMRRQTPERDAIEQLFRDIAGPNEEIGWAELKRILDHSMRDGEYICKRSSAIQNITCQFFR